MQHFSKKIILLFSVIFVTACQSKPTVDQSVDYENARSIPTLQVPAPVEKDNK